MKRPSFQFYPGDWTSDLKLRRCSPAARGVWVDVLCALHDSDDGYGLLRWPLKDIASTIGASMQHVRELVDKGVLRGGDAGITEPLIHVPRSGRKDGAPVTLVAAQPGPLWYSKRLVKDEYLRTVRGEGTRFGEPEGADPKAARKASPKPPKGDGPSSSSSSSEKNPPTPRRGEGRFPEFWSLWPNTDRKQDRKKCLAKWQRNAFDADADAILAHVTAMKATRKWLDGFEPAPLTYLNGERWKDGVASEGFSRERDVDLYAGAK